MVKLLYVVSQRHAAIILKSKGMYFFKKRKKYNNYFSILNPFIFHQSPYSSQKNQSSGLMHTSFLSIGFVRASERWPGKANSHPSL